MKLEIWFAYLSVASVATFSPGIMVMLVMARSVEYGWRRTVFSALGNATGVFLLSLATVSGLTLILMTSEIAFIVIKYIGALYLMYLGYKQFRTKSSKISSESKIGNSTRGELFVEAMTMALTNPKAWIFLNALLPQFVDRNESIVPQFVLLISTLLILSVACLVFYALVAHKLRNRIQGTLFNKITGATFFVLGAALIGSVIFS